MYKMSRFWVAGATRLRHIWRSRQGQHWFTQVSTVSYCPSSSVVGWRVQSVRLAGDDDGWWDVVVSGVTTVYEFNDRRRLLSIAVLIYTCIRRRGIGGVVRHCVLRSSIDLTHSLVSIGVVCRGRRASTSCHRWVSHTGDVTFSVRGSIPGSGGTSTSGYQASQRRNERAVYKDKSRTTSARSSRLVSWVRFYLCLFHFSVVSWLEIG